VRGRLVSETGTDVGVGLQLSYTPLGQISSVALANRGTMGYTYDRAGRTSRLTYPDGTTVDRSYQSDGQLQQVRRNGVVQASYRYDTIGRMDQVTRANGTVTIRTHDALDRVLTERTSPGTPPLFSLIYVYTRSGLTFLKADNAGRTALYRFDGRNQLMSDEPPNPEYPPPQYTYDLVGNLTQINKHGTIVNREYNERSQRVGAGFQYDAAGNLLNDGQRSYEYNVFGHLKATIHQQTGERTEYRYTSSGQLTDVIQPATGTTTRYVPDFTSALPEMLSDGTTNIVYGAHDERLQSVTGSNATWYTQDHLGTIRQTVNDAGIVTGRASFDDWGQPLQNTTGSRFGFTGELTDNGLVYLRARWYNPANNQFISRDPFPGVVTSPQSLHPYAYAHNNPVTYTVRVGGVSRYSSMIAGPFGRSGRVSIQMMGSPTLKQLLSLSSEWLSQHGMSLLMFLEHVTKFDEAENTFFLILATLQYSCCRVLLNHLTMYIVALYIEIRIKSVVACQVLH
jgi:RHS repeat-associated protein